MTTQTMVRLSVMAFMRDRRAPLPRHLATPGPDRPRIRGFIHVPSDLYLFFAMSNPLSGLRRLLRQKSVKTGDFTLASGRRSTYYIDARLTTMSGAGQLLVGEACHNAIIKAGWRPEYVGGMTLGADPIAYAIAAHATRSGHALDAFTVRKSPKGHGTGRQIEGGLPAGARVVVIEDSVTSGGSLLAALKVIENHGAVVVGVLALVDRREGGTERLLEAGYDFRALFDATDLL